MQNCLDGNAGACENFVALNLLGRNQKNETPLHTEDGEDISQFFGQSSFSNYVTANEKNIVKVDDKVDLRYLGPLGCGFMTGVVQFSTHFNLNQVQVLLYLV